MCLIPNLLVGAAALIVYVFFNNIWNDRKYVWKKLKKQVNSQLDTIGREDLKLKEDR